VCSSGDAAPEMIRYQAGMCADAPRGVWGAISVLPLAMVKADYSCIHDLHSDHLFVSTRDAD
jgi:hypothetical protein